MPQNAYRLHATPSSLGFLLESTLSASHATVLSEAYELYHPGRAEDPARCLDFIGEILVELKVDLKLTNLGSCYKVVEFLFQSHR